MGYLNSLELYIRIMGRPAKNVLHALLGLVALCSWTPARECSCAFGPIPGVHYEEDDVHTLGGLYVDHNELIGYILAANDSCAPNLNKSCNDLVIALMYSRAYQRAYDLSLQLFELYPEEYNVVITYAVACELTGRLEEALSNLERAIRLNPRSHEGSEWIHLNILKAHAAGRYSPTPTELIGIDLSSDSLTLPAFRPRLDSLLAQVHYQVRDRLYFANKDGDKTFGAMLYAYADLLYLTGYDWVAIGYYEMALDFGYEPPTVNRRYQIAKAHNDRVSQLRERAVLLAEAKTKAEDDPEMSGLYYDLLRENSRLRNAWYWAVGIGGAVVVLIGFWMWRRSKRMRG